jgi:site-specific DNA-adenine methylase
MRAIEVGLLSVDCLKASHTSVHAVPGGILIPELLFYPGSKNSKLNKILPRLLPLVSGVEEYREPFAGSGVIGLSVMSRCPQLSYWLNDRDPGLACLWYAARHHGPELVKLVETFAPERGRISGLQDPA